MYYQIYRCLNICNYLDFLVTNLEILILEGAEWFMYLSLKLYLEFESGLSHTVICKCDFNRIQNRDCCLRERIILTCILKYWIQINFFGKMIYFNIVYVCLYRQSAKPVKSFFSQKPSNKGNHWIIEELLYLMSLFMCFELFSMLFCFFLYSELFVITRAIFFT